MRVRTLLTRRANAGAAVGPSPHGPCQRKTPPQASRRTAAPCLMHGLAHVTQPSPGSLHDAAFESHGLADAIQQKQACCQLFAPFSPVFTAPGAGFACPGGRNRREEWRTDLPRRPTNQRRPGRVVHRRSQFGAGKNSYPGVKYMSAPIFTLLSTAAGAVCHGCSLDTARGEP